MKRNGRDAFHCVPDFSLEVWDAVERVPAEYGGASSFNSLVGDEVTRL